MEQIPLPGLYSVLSCLQIDFLNTSPSSEDYFSLSCMNGLLTLRFTSCFFFPRLVCGFHIADNLRADFSICLITASVSLVWRLTQLKMVASEHDTRSQCIRWMYSEVCKINHMVALLLLNELLGVSLTHSKNKSERRDLLWGFWAGQPDHKLSWYEAASPQATAGHVLEPQLSWCYLPNSIYSWRA